MFCSTIIPTVNRPTLSRAVHSVLQQDFNAEDFEVVVVNDSGRPVPEADWQHSPRVRTITTLGRERCFARNAGASIAAGRYLHFLDDDDVFLPGALREFWSAAQASDAVWLYGYWRTVDNNGALVDEFRPELRGSIFAVLLAGEGLPLGGSLVRSRAFFEAGGFDPRQVGTEDRDLGRRLALQGSVSYVPVMAVQIRTGEVGSTTNWAALAENDRVGREKALHDPKAMSGLRASANSNYWRGRVCRALFGSMLWNLQHRRLLTAASRIGPGVAFGAGRMLSADFWRGVRRVR